MTECWQAPKLASPQTDARKGRPNHPVHSDQGAEVSRADDIIDARTSPLNGLGHTFQSL